MEVRFFIIYSVGAIWVDGMDVVDENTSSTNSLERLDTIDWNTVHGYFVIEQIG